MIGLLDTADLQKLLDEVILARDEALKQLEHVDEENKAIARDFVDMQGESDRAKGRAKMYLYERDQCRVDLCQARRYAEEYRNKFVTAMGGRYDDERFRLPWEGEE